MKIKTKAFLKKQEFFKPSRPKTSGVKEAPLLRTQEKHLLQNRADIMEYSRSLLQTRRFQSMYDAETHRHFAALLRSGENFADRPEQLLQSFKESFHDWLEGSRLNSVKGLAAFPDRDIIIGCTHYLDDLHLTRRPIAVLEKEYQYHARLSGRALKTIKAPEELQAGDHLIVSLPFCYYGDIHPDMDSVLAVCEERHIPVHIDGCWTGCSRDIHFDFDRPCIQSAGFSLSKSLGLGANRIGLRYARRRRPGPVSIMNDFNMNNLAPVYVGLSFIKKFGSDFWQNKYGESYRQVCKDFGLRPTKAIHLAFDGERPVGVRRLLRALYRKKEEEKGG